MENVMMDSRISHAKKILMDTISGIREYMDDPAIQEIMINPDGSLWIEKNGIMTHVGEVQNATAQNAIILMARMQNASVSAGDESGIVDARLPDDGSRFAGILSPPAVGGCLISIRKHARRVFTLDEYYARRAFDQVEQDEDDFDENEENMSGARFLEWLKQMVKARKNILVSGGTSTGKTTFLNAMIKEVDINDRVIIIEDTPELESPSKNTIKLEANPRVGITINRLVRASLRLRPDRIIIGEVRGKEAYDMLYALNTGHSGGMTTLHGDTPDRVLNRMEAMIMEAGVDTDIHALRQKIASTFDIVIQLGRSTKGERFVSEAVKLLYYDPVKGQYITKNIFTRKKSKQAA